jgi:hypothetical protein
MDQRLIEILTEIRRPPCRIQLPDGSGLLLLRHGVRVLGLYGRDTDVSFFWSHPALDETHSARAFFETPGWTNPGGDRLWVSPEVDFFYPDYPSMGSYRHPSQLDPGCHKISARDGGAIFTNTIALMNYRTGEHVDLEVTKSYSGAADPLLGNRDIGSYEYAGYTQQATLAALNPLNSAVGLWSLVQLPHGGEAIIPTTSRATPRVYFGDVRAEHLALDDRAVRYCVCDRGIQKIGVKAAVLTGRMGYVYQQGEQWSLVVRSFDVDPRGEYVDTPPDDLNDTGYAVQVCNVNIDELGAFAELEYHCPAIGPASQTKAWVDTSRLWAYRGSREVVEAIARMLLLNSEDAQ